MASEIKALLALGFELSADKPDLSCVAQSEAALESRVHSGRHVDVQPNALLRHPSCVFSAMHATSLLVHLQLPPGHFLTCTADGNIRVTLLVSSISAHIHTQIRRYWHQQYPDKYESMKDPRSEKDLIEEVCVLRDLCLFLISVETTWSKASGCVCVRMCLWVCISVVSNY